MSRKIEAKRHHMFHFLFIRIIMYIICSIILVTVPLLYMLYNYSKEEIDKQNKESIRLINEIVDDFFHMIELTENTIATEPDIVIPFTLYYALPDYDEVKTREAFLLASKTIQNMILFKEGIQYSFIGKDGPLPIFSTNEKLNPLFLPKNALWYEKVTSDMSKSHIIFGNQRDYYFSAESAISVIRAIPDPKSSEPIVFIIMDITYSSLHNVIAKTNPSIPVEITDSSNRLIYSNLDKETSSDNKIVGQHTSEGTGIKVTTYGPPHVFTSKLNQILLISFITILIVFIIVFVTSLVSTWRFTNPIYLLIENMKQVKTGELALTYNYKGEISELHDLFDSFATLLSELRNMIKVNYQTHLLKTEAEFQALLQKTDPHFLYNILETISSQALIDGSTKASVMCQKLGAMFSYNLQDDDIVTLKSEIEYVKDYLYLTKYGVSFQEMDILYNIDPKTWTQLMPKMTLQPIIENCVKHAFDQGKNHSPRIAISSFIINQKVQIEISDNGKGMGSEGVEQLKEKLKILIKDVAYSGHGHGLGLRQVHARLNHYFGMDYKMNIASSLEGGTTITLVFPHAIEREN